jgi:hypothetical protein
MKEHLDSENNPISFSFLDQYDAYDFQRKRKLKGGSLSNN